MKENIKIFLRDEENIKEEEISPEDEEVKIEDTDVKKSKETKPTKNAKKSEKNENSEIKMTQEEYSEYLELKKIYWSASIPVGIPYAWKIGTQMINWEETTRRI